MAHNNDHKYFMIFNVSELNLINFSEVEEDSIYTVMKSISETLTFVKWQYETTPPSVEALTTREGAYTYDEMIVILSTSEWSEDII